MKNGKALLLRLAILTSLLGYAPFCFLTTSFAGPSTIIIKLSDQVSLDNPHYRANQYFADLVAHRTNGGIKVIVFQNSALGNARDSLESTLLGSIEMTKAAAAEISSFCPKFRLFSLPYIFLTREEVFAALEGEVGQILRTELEEKGLKLIAFYDTGFRSLFNAHKPILSAEDLKGMRIRVINDPIMMETFNTFGAVSIPLPYQELYEALQKGVVDGAEQPPVALYAMKFYEVAKYLSLTNHFYDLNVLVIGKDFFDRRLSPEQQRVLIEAGAETQIFERTLWRKYEEHIIEQLQEKGMKVNAPDTVTFKAAVKPIIEKNKKEIGEDFVNQALLFSQ